MRKVPENRAAPIAPVVRAHPTRTIWELSYRFITPVFGGGVKVSGHHKPFDPRTPVRASAIRGQLRFWWRAVNPRRCKSVAELAEAEATVFGRASDNKKRDGAALAVTVTRQPGPPGAKSVFESKEAPRRDQDGNPTGEFKWNVNPTVGSGLAYGVFSLRDDRKEIRHPTPHEHGTLWDYDREWTVRFDFAADDFTNDLEAALWGWTNFGGLGARTRRGFGAIALVRSQGRLALPSLSEGWERWKLESAPAVNWPSLRGAINEHVVELLRHSGGRSEVDARNSGQEAQDALLNVMRQLRQGTIGRNRGGQKHPGRSFWPEPDAIRRWANKHHPNHAPTHPLDKEAFPRGMFGAPIIFHFKDEGTYRNSDPKDTSLTPEGCGRMASPLILRPALENNRYIPRALRLRVAVPTSFRLTGSVAVSGLRVDLHTHEITSVTPLADDPDPITRYLNLLRNGR